MYNNIDPSPKFIALALRLALGYGIAFSGFVGQASAEQTIYKWVDAKGATHYSYRAPQNAKKTSKVRTYNDYNSSPLVPSTDALNTDPETPATKPSPLSNQPPKPQQSPTPRPNNAPSAEQSQPETSKLSQI